MRFLLVLILSLAACRADSDPASLTIDAVAGHRASSGIVRRVPNQEPPQLTIERLPSRSAGVVAVNAAGGTRIDFQLTDTTGEKVTLASFKGRLVVMFFGATSCQHVCPDTLARLHQAETKLGTRPSQVAFVMVATDGDRANADAFGEFITHFSPNMIGLTGAPQAVQALAGRYDIALSGHGANNHQNPVVVLDANGYWRQTIAGDTDARELARVLRPWLEELRTSLTQNTRQNTR